jgi:hypothetical protein
MSDEDLNFKLRPNSITPMVCRPVESCRECGQDRSECDICTLRERLQGVSSVATCDEEKEEVRHCKYWTCDEPLIKICPLGTDVGGFLWQCTQCKTVYADWELKE